MRSDDRFQARERLEDDRTVIGFVPSRIAAEDPTLDDAERARVNARIACAHCLFWRRFTPSGATNGACVRNEIDLEYATREDDYCGAGLFFMPNSPIIDQHGLAEMTAEQGVQ